MVVYETPEAFVMVEQHQHALLSGAFARRWSQNQFSTDDRKESVILGITEHDRGWLDIDANPFWNDAVGRPYSFIDYPLIPKLTFYKKGIDELYERDRYAALLVSLHYCSFFNATTNERALEFVAQETKRQEAIQRDLAIHGEKQRERLHYHFTLLQLCDDISLYICMQRPGIPKSEEIDWFKDGFPQEFDFPHGNRLIAQWNDEQSLIFSDFPFESEFEAEVLLKRVSKEAIAEHGMASAYLSTPYVKQSVWVR